MLRERNLDLAVVGGDMPALLLAWRMAKRGWGVTLVAEEIGAGAFGQGPGILSAHEGYDAYDLEREKGCKAARDFLAYRQFVLDEFDQDLASFSPEQGLKKALGIIAAHNPCSMLALRNHHEALNRHGALRGWGDALSESDLQAARLVSFHGDDRICEPGALCRTLALAFKDYGGEVCKKSEATFVAEMTISFAGSHDTRCIWETLVETEPDGESHSATWYRDAYPMYDTARRCEDGSWILGSRRSWAINSEDSSYPRDHDLFSHAHLKPCRTWQRSFALFKEPTLPSLYREGNALDVHGAGQGDPIMDLIAVDLALRELMGLPHIFSDRLASLPQAEPRRGSFAHMALQSFLDAQFSRDIRERSQT